MGVEVVDVVVADVAGEPVHDRAHADEARRFDRGEGVVPLGAVAELDARAVVLQA